MMALVRGSCCAVAALVLLCGGCTTPPQQTAEDDYHAPKMYRTGSNIAVKDYGAENIEIRTGEILHPLNRPMQGVLSKKPGG